MTYQPPETTPQLFPEDPFSRQGGEPLIGASNPWASLEGDSLMDRYTFGQEPIKPSLRDRVSMRAVALGASVLVLAGGGVVTHDLLSSPVSASQPEKPGHGDPGQESHSLAADIAPITKEASDQVRSDFASALAVDRCETKTTLDGLTSMYQRLFTTEERPNLSSNDLTFRAQQVSDRLKQDRTEQGFVALPSTFAQLEADAGGGQSLPLDIYKQTITQYLEQFGVKTLFDWHEQNTTSTAYDRDQDHLSQLATPLEDAENTPNSLREHIVTTMKSFSMLPPSIVKHANVSGQPTLRLMAFGNIKDANAGGLMIGDSTIIIDTDFTGLGVSHSNMLTGTANTASHEYSHALQRRICGELINVAANGEAKLIDPAFASLNQSLKYGPEAVMALDAGKTIDNRYDSLVDSQAPPNVEIAVAKGYGATNVSEDVATSLGEHVLYGPGIINLMSGPGDKTILQEKVTLSIARLEVSDPAAARYIVDMFAVARLQASVQILATSLSDRIVGLTTEHYDPNNSRPTDIDSPDSEFQKLQHQYDAYTALGQQLADVIKG